MKNQYTAPQLYMYMYVTMEECLLERNLKNHIWFLMRASRDSINEQHKIAPEDAKENDPEAGSGAGAGANSWAIMVELSIARTRSIADAFIDDAPHIWAIREELRQGIKQNDCVLWLEIMIAIEGCIYSSCKGCGKSVWDIIENVGSRTEGQLDNCHVYFESNK